MGLVLIPDIAVAIYCGLTGQCLEGEAKRHLWKIHINCRIAESCQIAPTTRFAGVCFACLATAKGQASTPHYDTYCKIWVKKR
jgi:hypothetical protein